MKCAVHVTPARRMLQALVFGGAVAVGAQTLHVQARQTVFDPFSNRTVVASTGDTIQRGSDSRTAGDNQQGKHGDEARVAVHESGDKHDDGEVPSVKRLAFKNTERGLRRSSRYFSTP